MPYKFKVKQMVRLKRPGVSDHWINSAGIYEIIRLMPADQTGELSYRIKSGMVERAVREGEIRGV